MSDIRIPTGLENMTAFKALYDRYAPALYGLVLKVTPDSIGAAKALEESFLKIWRERETYDSSKSTVFTWMLVITLKHCTEISLLEKRSPTFEYRNLFPH
jgi:DNA-directed RNA polymerase specialized sigma24 family protein